MAGRLLKPALIRILALSLILVGFFNMISNQSWASPYAGLAISYFLPGIISVFLISFFLTEWFLKVIDQPPLMIFILGMVVKMMAGLSLLLIYLVKKIGPDNEGAILFICLYLIFEFQEIRRFVSILRPNSENIK